MWVSNVLSRRTKISRSHGPQHEQKEAKKKEKPKSKVTSFCSRASGKQPPALFLRSILPLVGRA